MPSLFDSITLRDVTIRNRVFMPPMCMYRCEADGIPNEFHMVHYGARALGGVGLIIWEATGVSPEGRISPGDCGLWNDAQVEAFKPITAFIKEFGCTAGIQLGHAGRKAATKPSREGAGPLDEGDVRGWTPLAPSALPFDSKSQTPAVMTQSDIEAVIKAFADATKRAIEAGFEFIQIHGAHGYLLHEFLSPLTNKRDDCYGGSLENRLRFPLAVAQAVRGAAPSNIPVTMRVSATDYVEGGWDLPQTIAFAHALKKLGIDMMDVSSGGLVPDAKIPTGPGYQVSFADAVRHETGMPCSTVGQIFTGKQAQSILDEDKADAICIGRPLLADPHWALRAAHELGLTNTEKAPWPEPYLRGKFHD